MFRFLSGIPRRLKNIFSHSKEYFTKPQYNNFCRTKLSIISAGKKEHDTTSLNNLFIDQKNQNSLNRFITNPKYNHKNLLNQAKTLLLQEATKQQHFTPTQPNIEHHSIDR